MSIKCGRGHSHETTAEVRACYGLSPDGPVQNLVPQGPAPANPRAKEIAQKKANDELQRWKASRGEPHFFTTGCPRCVAGTCVNDPTQARYNGHNQTRNDRLTDEPNTPGTFPEPVGRPNRYGGKCVECNQWVEAEAGLLGEKLADKKWAVRHLPGQCPAPDPAKQSADGDPEGYGDPQPQSHSSLKLSAWTDIPEGLFATPSFGEKNDLDFWRVRYGRSLIFVNRVIGGHQDQEILADSKERIKTDRDTPKATQYNALVAIREFGPEKSHYLAGIELKFCRRCGIHLTDEVSRRNGIGPDCATK